MFKISIISAMLILSTAGFVFSQNSSKDLTDQAFADYQQGKFEKAAAAAEKVVKLEKSNRSNNSVSYVNALANLARINQGYLVELQTKVVNKSVAGSERFELHKKIAGIASDIEKILREIIQINEKDGRAQTVQTADVKVELASLVQNYNSNPVRQSSREKIDEAEKLLSEALSTSEQVRGKDDGKTMTIVLLTGDFYKKYVNFEKFCLFTKDILKQPKKSKAKTLPN